MYFYVQWESLYVEALYTIKHRIGRNADNDHELYEYVQTAFSISASEHARLMTKACQEKVSHFPDQEF